MNLILLSSLHLPYVRISQATEMYLRKSVAQYTQGVCQVGEVGMSGKSRGIHFTPLKVREKSGNFSEIKKSFFLEQQIEEKLSKFDTF